MIKFRKKGVYSMNKRIKELRKYLGLTLDKFGERLGVKKAAVSKWENGDNVTEQMIKSICREFNVNEKWLRYGSGEMFTVFEDSDTEILKTLLTEKNDIIYQTILSIAKAYKRLSPESKKVFNNLIQEELEKNQQPTQPEKTVAELEEEYKKTILHSASKTTYPVSNITDAIEKRNKAQF